MKDYEMGNDTKIQLNALINNLQSKAFSNSNNSYNDEFINSKVKNLDINVFRSFGINENVIENKENKVIKDINLENNINNINPNSNSYNNLLNKYSSSFDKNNINMNMNMNDNNYNNNYSYDNYNINYYDIKNIIRNEFAELIIPYQKQMYNNNNSIQEKINNVETRLQGMINSKSLDNINETAKMINICMKDFNINYQNNKNSNLENKLNLIVKNQYDNKLDILEKQIVSMNSLLKTFQNTFDSNMLDIIKYNQKKKEKSENSIVEKNDFENYKNNINKEINNIKKEIFDKYKNLNEQINIKINSQINQINNNINKIVIENNKDKDNDNLKNNENILNDLNILKNNLEKVTEEMFGLKSKLNFQKIEKLNNLDIDGLKYDIDNVKEYVNSLDNNINEIREISQDNNKNIFELKKNINNLDKNINDINKDIENVNNDNLNQKYIDLNNKLEEFIKNKNNK